MAQNNSKKMYQNCIVTLSDGRKLTFIGPAQAFDRDKGIAIVDIAFTNPKPLPENCYFETLDNEK
jgi:hypothetical protein